MHRVTRLTVSFLLFALIAMSLSPARSAAQGGFGSRATAGIFAGVTFPRGDLSDEVKTGWHAGALAKMRAYGALDARIDGTYTKFGKKALVGGGASVSTDASIAFGTLNALVNLGADSAAYPGDNTVSPYLVAGVGGYRLDFKATCVGACTTFVAPDAKTYFGLNIGGGASVPLAGIRTFLEARYHRISRSDANGGTRTMVLVSAGVKFR